jgi:hypothetical protein
MDIELTKRLKYCKLCVNRSFDASQGIVCGLTKSKPTFENICPDYKRDESVPEEIDNRELSQDEFKDYVPEEILQKLKQNQNFELGIVAGIIASLLGAILWAVITVATKYQIGYMALAIGALVGFSIRYFGKGVEKIYGIIGAGLSLFGCVLGNLLSIIGFVSLEYSIGFFQVFSEVDLFQLIDVYFQSFQIMDLLFYGIAIYEGYQFSFLKITKDTIQNL